MTRGAITIAVTALNATDNPGPGVTVIRALRMQDGFTGKIVGLSYDSLDPGLYASELKLDAAYLLPYPSHGAEPLLERLRYIHSVTPIDVLIPTLDAELPAMIAIQDDLRRMGIATYLPTRAQLELRSKVRLAELGHDSGLAVPLQAVITDEQELYSIDQKVPYPIVVKGVFYGAQVCHSLDEAKSAFYGMVAKWGLPVIVQKYHPGNEFDVVALGDGHGNMLGAVPMKKLYITDKGKAWAGVVVQDPALLEVAATFIRATRWRGPCEVEVMRSPDGVYHLIEINPRFPAWTVLAAGAGQNLPWATAQLALGEAVPSLPPFKPGVMFVRIAIDLITHVDRLQEIATTGQLSVR
jgi:carbamoyl-phosphate synthase large subunit